MSKDHANRGFLPPPSADDLHRQPPPAPPSAATLPAGENPHRFTPLSQTPPTTPKPTPESQLAAAIGRAIHAIPATTFRDAIAAAAANTVNPLRRTLSDASSSDYPQSSTITPPKAPERSGPPLRRTVSDPTSLFRRQETEKTLTPPPPPKVPVARTVFPATNPRAMVLLPESCNRKESPGFKRLRKIEETVRDIEQRCWEVMQECESVVSEEHLGEDNSSQGMMMVQEEGVKEECVAFETLGDGGLRFRLSCSCGKRFEILLKDNGCFYKLT